MHVLGIPVKTQERDGGLMHHKFFIIDEDTPNAKIFVGSLNLTMHGLCANVEAVVTTDDKRVIDRFKEEFELMWSTFSIYKRPKIGNN